MTPTDKKTVDTETTKERCLENFMRLAQALDEKIAAEQEPETMLDWVDPSTGLMMKGDNYNAVYQEQIGVDYYLKSYKSVQVGMCRLVDHPKFGLGCYPASIFTSI